MGQQAPHLWVQGFGHGACRLSWIKGPLSTVQPNAAWHWFVDGLGRSFEDIRETAHLPWEKSYRVIDITKYLYKSHYKMHDECYWLLFYFSSFGIPRCFFFSNPQGLSWPSEKWGPADAAMGAGPLRGQVPLTALGPEDVLSAAPGQLWWMPILGCLVLFWFFVRYFMS